MDSKETNYISLQEATNCCNYTQEYLSLRARQGKLKAMKFGRNWVTKKEWLTEYLQKVEEYNEKVNNNKKEVPVEKITLPPENLPVEKLPALRFGFVVALVFVLATGSGVFGKTSFENFYDDLDPYVKQINQTVNVIPIETVSLAMDFSQNLDRGEALLASDISNSVYIISRAGDALVETAAEPFRDSFVNVGHQAGDEFHSSLRFAYARVANVGGLFGEYSQWITKNYKIANDFVESKWRAANEFVEGKINQALEFVTSPWDKEPIDELVMEDEMEEEIEEQPIEEKEQQIVEVTKIEQPIREVVKETVREIVKIDEETAQKVETLGSKADEQAEEIKDLQAEVKRRPSGYLAPVTASQPVSQQSREPRISVYNGQITLITTGSGNIIFTAADNIVASSKNFIIGGNLSVSGTQTFTASSTATALTVTQSGTGNIVEFKDGGTSVFTIADGGYATFAINASTTPAVLIRAQDTLWTSASSTYFAIAGTSTFAGKFIDIQKDGTSLFYIDGSGNTVIGGTLSVSTTTSRITGDLTMEGNILPATTTTHNLGSETYQWANVYSTALRAVEQDLNITSASSTLITAGTEFTASSTATSTFVQAGSPWLQIDALGNITATGTTIRATSTTIDLVAATTTITGKLETTGTTTLATDGSYVGIGTSTPIEALTVIGNIWGSGNIVLHGNTTSSFFGPLYIESTTSPQLVVASDTAHSLAFTINNTESQLYASQGFDILANASSTWQVSNDDLFIRTNTSGDLVLDSASSAYILAGVDFIASSTQDFILFTAGQERLMINAAGNIIATGTTVRIAAPVSTIDLVAATTTITGKLETTATTTLATDGSYVGIGTTTPFEALTIQGNIYGSGNAVFKGTMEVSTTTVLADVTVKGNIVPNDAAGVYYIGMAPDIRWDFGYFGEIHALNVVAASTTIGGTSASMFTINSDAVGDENSSIEFYRGGGFSPALIGWSAPNDRFEFNFPIHLSATGTISTAGNLNLNSGAASTWTTSGLTIQSTGDIIATTTENIILTLGDVAGAKKLYITDSSGATTTAVFTIDSDGNTMATGTLAVAATTTLAINEGFVGIATTTPYSTEKLSVYGNIWGSGNIVVADTAATSTFYTALYSRATTTLGSATSTPTILTGFVQSSIIPYTHSAYDLGTADLKWQNLYVSTTTIGDTIVIGTDSMTASAGLTIQSTGDITATSTGNIVLTSAGSTLITAGTDFTVSSTATSTFVQAGSPWLQIDALGNITATGTTLGIYGTTTFMGGYVGIGTTTPAYTLSVVGNVYGSGNAIFGGTLSSATTTITGDLLPAANLAHNLGSNAAKWANIYVGTTTIGSTITINSDTLEASTGLTVQSTGDLTATSTTDIILVSAGSEAIRASSGRVGIGGVSPSYDLDVSGDFRVTATSTLATTTISGTLSPTNVAAFALAGDITGSASPDISGIGTFSGTYLNVTTATATNLYITGITALATTTITGDLTVNTDDLYIQTSSGNIGIGTTTPQALTHIYGSAATSTLTVQQTGSGNIIDFMSTSTSVFTLESEDMLTLRSGLVQNWGSFNTKIIDSMDAPSGWISSNYATTSTTTESSIVKVNDGSLKITTTVGGSATDTIQKAISNEDWYTGYSRLSLWIRAGYTTTSTDATTSQIISVMFHDTGATSTHNITIKEMNKWQYEEWDISGIAEASRNSIDWIQFRIDNDYGSPTFYIDHLRLYNADLQAAEIFVDAQGNAVFWGQESVEIGRTSPGGSLPSIKAGSAVVEINQPLSVNVGGDVGFDYDIYFANTGLSQITSAGPLAILAGDSNHSENLTLGTQGTGDVIVDIVNSTTTYGGLKVLGSDSGSYVARIGPTGDMYIGGTGSGGSDLWVKQNIIQQGGYLTINPLNPSESEGSYTISASANADAGGSCTSSNNYYYRLAALNDNGETTPSAPSAIVTPADTTSTISVSWQPVSGATKYKLYRHTGQLVENCEDTWDAAPNATTTCGITTDYKVGTKSASTTISTSTETGLVSYENLDSALDLSDQYSIGFWIKSSIDTDRGDLKFLVDEQVNCTSSEESLSIPALEAGTWKFVKLSFENTTTTRGSVDCIGLSLSTDRGAQIVQIDDVNTSADDDKWVGGNSSTYITAPSTSYTDTCTSTDTSATPPTQNTTGGKITVYRGNDYYGSEATTTAFEVNEAVVTIGQPLSVETGGDMGLNYDLAFLNTGISYITSAGPLWIKAGNQNKTQNLVLTTAGESGKDSGDVIVDIRYSNNTYGGFKVIGDDSGGYVFRISPAGDIYVGGSGSGESDLVIKENLILTGGNIYVGQLATPTSLTFNSTSSDGFCDGTYYYRIAAANTNGETLSSATTTTGVTGASSTVTMSWNAVSGATKYYLYRSTDSEFAASSTASTTGAISAPSTSYTDTCTSTQANTTVPYLNTTGGDILPPGERLGSLGTDARSWESIWVQNTYAGDIIFANKFRITEAMSTSTPEKLILQNASSTEIMTLDENGKLVVDKVEADVARLNMLEMVDRMTGAIWCTWIENGEWIKVSGGCNGEEGDGSGAPVGGDEGGEECEPEITRIDTHPAPQTTADSVSFDFSCPSDPYATFEIRIDSGEWEATSSPAIYYELAVGQHTFYVRATDVSDYTEPCPDSYTWEVLEGVEEEPPAEEEPPIEEDCIPEDEVCDGIDNDCDEEIDEDCTCIEGYADCDDDMTNGCEFQLETATSTCPIVE